MRDAILAIPFGYIGAGTPTSILFRTPYPNDGPIQEVHDMCRGNYNSCGHEK
jgi:hypothetical protein